MTTKHLLAAALTAGLVATAAAPAEARSCRPVKNIFDGTRYEGSDLYRIRAQNVSCARARKLAYRATYKAIGYSAALGPVLHFRVDAWRVADDLRGDSDRLSASASGGRRVTWRFGDL